MRELLIGLALASGPILGAYIGGSAVWLLVFGGK